MGKKRDNRVGSVVFSTNTGLGILAKSFYSASVFHKAIVCSHPTYATQEGWYKKEDIMSSERELLNNIDTLLLFEVANPENILDWGIVQRAKRKGIKVVLMPMYESTPFPLPELCQPDLWIFPSELDESYFNSMGITGELVRVPVEAKPRVRKKVTTFIHNAGSSGSQLNDRNGTQFLLDALPLVESDIRLIFRSRDKEWKIEDPRVEIYNGDVAYEDLWEDGDVFIFPESYNGLSLPLQEAYAHGLGIIAGDRFPINTWMDNRFCIPARDVIKQRYCWAIIERAVYNRADLAKQIDSIYGQDIEEYSQKGIEWGSRNTWKSLYPIYKKLLNNERN